MTHTSRRHPRTDGRLSVGAVRFALWGALIVGLLGAGPAVAQTTDDGESTLIERYREARYQLLLRRRQRHKGLVPVLPPERLPTPTDSLYPSTRQTASAPDKSFPLHDVRPVRQLEREWFRKRFADVHWAFLGATPHYTFFDTTRTWDLRARLQAQFGDPTLTLADSPFKGAPDERAQFEYWFVVNDSIPVRVMNPRGPRGRGVILAAERRYRDRLGALRKALLAPLRHSKRAPYVDYYYDPRPGHWYRTGFDGQTFFLKRISRDAIVPGRRPRLDTTRTFPKEGSPAHGRSP